MNRSVKLIFSLILLLGLVACGTAAVEPSDDILAPLQSGDSTDATNAQPTQPEQAVADANLPTLLDLVSEDPNLVFFTSGLNNTGLTDDLQSGGPFTVFAPSNIAFSEAEIIVSQMDPALLGSIMDNHLVNGTLPETALLAAGSVTTLAGDTLAVTQEAAEVKVAYALLTAEARPASNGTLYVIDTLLLPQETGPEKSMLGVLQADGRFTTFLSAVEGTEWMGYLRFGELADAVLAPTDTAFANLPADIATLLETDPFAMEFLVNYHFLSPDGWPEDQDLTVAALVELGEISTRVPIGGSGFGRGFEKLIVTQTEAGVQINDANIISGDMDATNGVVHAIDAVLVPQALLEHTNE